MVAPADIDHLARIAETLRELDEVCKVASKLRARLTREMIAANARDTPVDGKANVARVRK